MGQVSPVIKKSAAANYSPLKTIPIQITADEPVFVPQYDSSSSAADVFALIPHLNHNNIQSLNLTHRQLHIIDCGIKIKLEEGYRLQGSLATGWALRGLFLSQILIEQERLKLLVMNLGQETPLVIPHKCNIAKIWIEPVYLFDWN